MLVELMHPRSENGTSYVVTTSKTTGKCPSPSNQTYIANVLNKNWPATGKNVLEEISEYELERTQPADCDPTSVYAYYDNRFRRWSRLATVARDVLSIPATSAASEREFSARKYVFGIARMSLKPKTVEALVCLRSWYKARLVGEKDVVTFLEEISDASQLEEREEEDVTD